MSDKLNQIDNHQSKTTTTAAAASSTSTTSNTSIIETECSTYTFPEGRSPENRAHHSRSASHGGGISSISATGIGGCSSVGVVGAAASLSAGLAARPSALKGARGHQRAFSQGQIANESSMRMGHSRVSSKTDFILPPGHKDDSEITTLPQTISATISKGHSRQASRSESIYTLRRSTPPSLWERLLCIILRRTPKYDTEERFRIVVPNHVVPPKTPRKQHPNGKRTNNKIRTTKYTLLSFLPRNLLEQFHRVANLYFIFIVLLNWFPSINAFGKEIAMIPVMFVLGVTAVKDLFEDRRRHASDKRINNSTCRIYQSDAARYKKVLWKEVRVGDLIHLSNNEVVPADILLLRSSDPGGITYIDTGHLDGETNLKQRQVARGFIEKQNVFEPSKFQSRIEVEAPTTKIYRFHGAIIHPSGERVPIGTDNLLLRESLLKNTDYIEGIVVYAGHETKAMLNNGGPRYKRSSLEKQMNQDVLWCVLILIILCLIGAVGCKLWLNAFNLLQLPYKSSNSDTTEAFFAFWTYIIILQIMIPLSLYVTLELCKIIQVYHIHHNVDLYDESIDKRTECRALNITEELGQIQYIFSDKTGTLTENRMIFRHCAIAGIDYNHPKMANDIKSPIQSLSVLPNQQLVIDLNLLNEQNLEENQYETCINIRETHAAKIQEFLLLLALCNTVVCSQHPHRDFMNASGIIEPVRNIFQDTNDYQRLEESHSPPTPSPPPFKNNNNTSTKLHQTETILTKNRKHMSSLTPINSCDNSPTSETLTIPNLRTTTKSRSKLLNLSLPPILTTLNKQRNNNNNNLTDEQKMKLNQQFQPSSLSSSSSSSSSTSSSPLPPPLPPPPTITSKNKHQNDSIKPIFEAESPDELALVDAAYGYNCRLLKRTPTSVLIDYFNDKLEFEILYILPFDSIRKRMSVIIRHPLTNEIILYCKGADSAILTNLQTINNDNEQKLIIEKTQQLLNNYARDGLRVLLMAKRILTEQEYNEWKKKQCEIDLTLDNYERRLQENYLKMECNLQLLGATGIEDRLQDGVPETLNSLISAGIVVWVLTGDKPETAMNIAYSSKLFSPQMELLKLMTHSKENTEQTIYFYLSEIENQNNGIQTVQSSSSSSTRTNIDKFLNIKSNNHHQSDGIINVSGCGQRNRKKALIIDGKTLTFILDRRSNLTKPFLKLTTYCSSVLCCRATPLQKAYIVRVVKEELKMRTLAIGDGANDVSMIQTADVGIGISGQEGMQAVMAADFAISKFKYLERLLLVHGHWSYDRLTRMVLYFFYKNACFVFLIFWYQLYCGFSGAVMIDQMYLMLYNLLFTSLPPLAIGVYDQDAPEELLRKKPYLYRQGRLGKVYKTYSFWLTMADALYQSLCIFFICQAAYNDSDIDIFEFGTAATTACMFVMLLHATIEIRSWTIIHVGSILLSIGAFYLYSLLYNTLCVNCLGLPSTYWIIQKAAVRPTYWLTSLIACVLALLPRYVIRVLKTFLAPDDVTMALIQQRRSDRRGEGFLVSWSRSTSTSSIYRTTDNRCKNNTLTAVG